MIRFSSSGRGDTVRPFGGQNSARVHESWCLSLVLGSRSGCNIIDAYCYIFQMIIISLKVIYFIKHLCDIIVIISWSLHIQNYLNPLSVLAAYIRDSSLWADHSAEVYLVLLGQGLGMRRKVLIHLRPLWHGCYITFPFGRAWIQFQIPLPRHDESISSTCGIGMKSTQIDAEDKDSSEGQFCCKIHVRIFNSMSILSVIPLESRAAYQTIFTWQTCSCLICET